MAAEQGRSKDRIKQVLKKSCSCKKDCMRKVSLKAVLATVLMFWSLSKTAQDTLLWSMQSSMTIGEDQDQSSDSEDESLPVKGDRSRTPRRVLHHWYLQGVSILILDIVFFLQSCLHQVLCFICVSVFLGGVQICRDAFIRLLGISGGRLVRTRRSFKGQDMRKFSLLATNMFCTKQVSLC